MGEPSERGVGAGSEPVSRQRLEEAIRAYEEQVRRHGRGTDLRSRELVAEALVGKAAALRELGCLHEAVLVYDEVLVRFGDAVELRLQDLVSIASVNEGWAVGVLRAGGQAAELPDEVLRRLAATLSTRRQARTGALRAGGYPCPVCGYPQPEPPWMGGSGSDEICPSCGIHFGYDDARRDLHATIYAARRERWSAGGMRWHSPHPPPEDWDPHWQLLALLAGREEGA